MQIRSEYMQCVLGIIASLFSILFKYHLVINLTLLQSKKTPHAVGPRAVCHLCLECAGHKGTLRSSLLSCQKAFEAFAPMTFGVTYHTTGLRSYSDRGDVEINALAARRRWWKAA